MSYFLFPNKLTIGIQYILSGDEAHHIINSRRYQTGEKFELQDSDGMRFSVVINKIEKRRLIFTVLEKAFVPPDSPLELEIVQALTKEKTVDLIIQKSTELGAKNLVFFLANNSSRSIHKEGNKKLMERWIRIADEACKQSGRQFRPEIRYFENLNLALDFFTPLSNQWILCPKNEWEGNTTQLSALKDDSFHHRIFIGPEGGWHPKELELAKIKNIQPINLGSRILRTETATIAAISIFQYLFGDLK